MRPGVLERTPGRLLYVGSRGVRVERERAPPPGGLSPNAHRTSRATPGSSSPASRTATTIVTFLLVALLQNSQRRTRSRCAEAGCARRRAGRPDGGRPARERSHAGRHARALRGLRDRAGGLTAVPPPEFDRGEPSVWGISAPAMTRPAASSTGYRPRGGNRCGDGTELPRGFPRLGCLGFVSRQASRQRRLCRRSRRTALLGSGALVHESACRSGAG
jgi:hypothetical protein